MRVEIVKVDANKPTVKTVTVTLTRAEAIDLAGAYEKYWGPATFTRNLKAAANGETVNVVASF